MKKILYIGNHLKKSNPTALESLTSLLGANNFEVVVYSNISNKFLRLFDMCFGVIKHRKADYLLIDTYSTFNYYYVFFTSQLARIFYLKYIPILHGGNLPMRLEKSALLAKWIFKNSFINVAPSKYLLDAFEKEGFNAIQIPNAIDLKKYPFKKRENIQPMILWLRAFDKIYNPNMAILVFHRLQKMYPLAKMCMVGPDKDGSMNEIKNLILKLKLTGIEITGKLSKSEWINKSVEFDIFLNTTNFDNMPVSVIEAMALGLPVVSTNVGGIPYLIENNKDGILVDKNDVNGMLKSVLKLIHSNSLTQEITVKARAKVEAFDRNEIADKWAKLLTIDE